MSYIKKHSSVQVGFTSSVSRSEMAYFFFCGPVARLISKDICQSDTLPENRSRCSTGELNEVFYVVRMLQTSSVLNPTIFFSEMLS